MGLFDRILGKPEGKLENPQDQPSGDQEITKYVRDFFENARTHQGRVSQEGICMTNIAYLLGYDGVYYDPVTRAYRPKSNATPYLKRNRVFVNKILPTVQNRTARLCKNPPKFDIRPNGPDSEEKDLARLKLQVLDMLWDTQKLRRKRIPLYMWAQQGGHSYIKVSFDAELGQVQLDPETNQLVYEGDIRTDVVGPLEVYPDPLAKDFDDLTRLGHAKVRKLDYFKTHYPDRGHLVKAEDAWLLSAQYEQRIQSMNNVTGGQAPLSQQMDNCAIELAYYEKRSSAHPHGRLIITANGVLLHDGPLPVGEIPFAKFDDIVVGGKYAGESTITHLRPLQDRKNELLSAKAAFIRKLLAGKYVAAKGSGLTQESLNDQSGEVIEFTVVPNAPAPQALTPPQMPQYVYQEEESIDRNFDDIIGINEVSKGQLPAAGIPAIGMQLLTEQDDTRIGIVTEQHEDAWAHVGRLLLLYAQKFYKTDRVLKISGKHQEYTVRKFTGEDLKGDHDVIVIPGSTQPGSKTLKRQEILNAWQQGLLGDPADPKVRENVLGMLEFGDVAEMWQDLSLDQAQAREVIETIEAGGVPVISEFDNQDLIWQELNRYRKTDKFDALPPDSQHTLIEVMEQIVQTKMEQVDPTIKLRRLGVPSPTDLAASAPPPEEEEGEPGIPPGPTPAMAGGF